MQKLLLLHSFLSEMSVFTLFVSKQSVFLHQNWVLLHYLGSLTVLLHNFALLSKKEEVRQSKTMCFCMILHCFCMILHDIWIKEVAFARFSIKNGMILHWFCIVLHDFALVLQDFALVLHDFALVLHDFALVLHDFALVLHDFALFCTILHDFA